MTYKFKTFNIEGHIVEIDEASIVVEIDGIVAHPDRMTIDAHIIYTAANGKTDVDIIREIPVENLNYNAATLNTRVMDRLKDLEI